MPKRDMYVIDFDPRSTPSRDQSDATEKFLDETTPKNISVIPVKSQSTKLENKDIKKETAKTTFVEKKSNETIKKEEPKEEKKSSNNSAIKSFISGGFGGACLVFVGYPFDTVKVKIQTTNEYKNSLDCLQKTIKADGVRGLYRGMMTPLIGSTPIFAVCFWGYDMGQKLVKKVTGDQNLGMLGIMAAGGFSAIPTTALMTPIERIKVVLQMQGINAEKGIPIKYKGPGDAFVQLFKEGGIKSIYRGTGATLLRDVPASVAYFGAYELIKKALTNKNGEISVPAILFAGGMAGIANWTVAIPPDVIKSRLQSAPEGTYSGTMDCFRKLVAAEGPQALFRGLGPAMLRAFPANAACFLGVELARKFLDKVM